MERPTTSSPVSALVARVAAHTFLFGFTQLFQHIYPLQEVYSPASQQRQEPSREKTQLRTLQNLCNFLLMPTVIPPSGCWPFTIKTRTGRMPLCIHQRSYPLLITTNLNRRVITGSISTIGIWMLSIKLSTTWNLITSTYGGGASLEPAAGRDQMFETILA